ALETGLDVFQRSAERGGRRGGGERVVDVVEARQRQLDGRAAVRGAQVDLRAAHPVQPYALGGDCGVGTRATAVRAAVAAEVAQVDRLVLVRVPAVAAVLRVRRM